MSSSNLYMNDKSYSDKMKYEKDDRAQELKKKEALVPVNTRKRSFNEDYVVATTHMNDGKFMPKLMTPLLSNERFHDVSSMQLKEDSTALPTCHLCGKAVCGQRMGRIQCVNCSKIFCLQQLQRKFDMVVDINDTNFRCPRCLGFCCCVCDCRRPPPHVHCKVYKVRENKRKRLENLEQPPPQVSNMGLPAPKQEQSYYSMNQMSQMSMNNPMKSIPLSPLTSTPLGLMPRTSSLTSMTTLDLSMQPIKTEDSMQGRLYNPNSDSYPIIVPSDPWPQNCNIWQTPSHMGPQNQGIDWLTALNDSLIVPSSPTPVYPPSSTQSNRNPQLLTEKLRYLFDNYQKMNSQQLEQEISFKFFNYMYKNDILFAADNMQTRAAKCDVLLRLVESFNKHAINAKITWLFQETRFDENSIQDYKPIPAFYTILKYYPNILFSIESSSFFCEREKNAIAPTSLSVTFTNTSSHRDQRGVATVVALIDNSLRRNYNVTFTEEWVSDPTMSWKNIGQIDQRKLRQMLSFAEEAQQKLDSSKEKSRAWLRIKKNGTETYLEKIPLLALLLKRLCADFNNLVFSLDKINIDGDYLQIIVEFNEKHDWSVTIPRYEKGIEVINPDEHPIQLQKVWSSTKLFSM
ncbi:hypothetical protein WA158_006734 [Blastocystis sp. Blastoise]